MLIDTTKSERTTVSELFILSYVLGLLANPSSLVCDSPQICTIYSRIRSLVRRQRQMIYGSQDGMHQVYPVDFVTSLPMNYRSILLVQFKGRSATQLVVIGPAPRFPSYLDFCSANSVSALVSNPSAWLKSASSPTLSISRGGW
jgi:hypothetical protein